MKTTGTSLLMVVLLAGIAGKGYAQVGRLDWTTAATPNVVDRAFTKADIAALVSDVGGRDGSDKVRPEAIGDFAWVDVDGGGTYRLLVTVAESRAFFNALHVYEKRNERVERRQTLDVWVLASFRDRIKDLDSDGYPELILPIKLDPGDYRGARPTAVWPAVYRWSDGHFVDSSGGFASYYRHGVLPELDVQLSRDEKMIDDATGDAAALEDLNQSVAATWMVRDKILRVTGEKPDAGVDRARKWMKSSSPDLRQDAAAVFADMGYKTELEALATDANREVAEAAKRGLGRSREKRA